ncbi:MAG: hypothetical protein ACI31G_01215 [Bacilli bacterium]
MKDKLEKFNHKAGYYRLKKFFLSSVLMATACMVIAVPSYISAVQTKAKEDEDISLVNESSEEEITLSSLLSYYI